MTPSSEIDIVSCRDDAINSLRNEMKEKNGELRRCKAKVSIQFKIIITNTKPLKLRYLLRTNVLFISNHFLLSKLTQFEENNKLVDRKRLLDVTPSRDDSHSKGKWSYSDVFDKLCLNFLEDPSFIASLLGQKYYRLTPRIPCGIDVQWPL